MSGRFPDRPSLLPDLVTFVLSLLLAFGVFAWLAMGECLPRDGSAAMNACDAGERFEFWAFPLAVILLLSGAALLRRKFGGWALVATILVPFAAMAVVLTIERAVF